ncbi:MAG: cytochrome c [Gammaproteobacteria bacterium]|nr:MAG: cytochrome c [Gammaproteobacteria bacterium]
MKKVLSVAILGLGLGIGTTALAADGAELYKSKGCVSCHGEGGTKPIAPNFPKIAGQNEAYLLQQMKDIKSGARANGQSAMMKGIVAGVSDEEMAAIAKWLSTQ